MTRPTLPRLLLPLVVLGRRPRPPRAPCFPLRGGAGREFCPDRDESILLITLTPPQGTVLETSGSTLPVEIFVERHSWEISRRPSDGFEEARSSNSEPASGIEARLSASPGATGDLLVVTDGQGLAATTYTGGGVPGSATLAAAVGERAIFHFC